MYEQTYSIRIIRESKFIIGHIEYFSDSFKGPPSKQYYSAKALTVQEVLAKLTLYIVENLQLKGWKV